MKVITELELRERMARLRERRDQIIADANALNGAIEDCEYWLAELAKEEVSEEVPESSEE